MKLIKINEKLYSVTNTEYKEIKKIRRTYLDNIGKETQRKSFIEYKNYMDDFCKNNPSCNVELNIVDIRINNK